MNVGKKPVKYDNKMKPEPEDDNQLIEPETPKQVSGVDPRWQPLQNNDKSRAAATGGNGGDVPAQAPIVRRRIIVRRPSAQQPMSLQRKQYYQFIEEDPLMHIGVQKSKLKVLVKCICPTAKIRPLDCYLTLKKLRSNESFVVLAQYFDLKYDEAVSMFVNALPRLARWLRFLISWPQPLPRYKRLKNLPFEFRDGLQDAQALVKCVETELGSELNIGFPTYKYVFVATPNGVITHISNAFSGTGDDIEIVNAANLRNYLPSTSSLAAVPGSQERSSNDSMRVVGNAMCSDRMPGTSLPIRPHKRNVGRDVLDETLGSLREFKILRPYGIQHPLLMSYAHEILIVTAALTNLLREGYLA